MFLSNLFFTKENLKNLKKFLKMGWIPLEKFAENFLKEVWKLYRHMSRIF